MTAAFARPPAWTEDALCAQVDVGDVFFPEGKGASANEAKAICAQCYVRQECLAWALDNHEEHGIWGGVSIHRERRRGEAPKMRRCDWCHGDYQATQGNRLYCGDDCRRASHREAKRRSQERRKAAA